MDNLILASHGNFCVELKKTAEMILGPQESIYTIPLLENEGEEEYSKKIEEVLNITGGNFTVFTDINGGSPSNIFTKKLLSGETFDLYTGMNLPMVIAYVNSKMSNEPMDYANEARNNTLKINDLLVNLEVDED